MSESARGRGCCDCRNFSSCLFPQISLFHSLSESEEQEEMNGVPNSSLGGDISSTKADDRKAILDERAGELVSLLNAFAFALQYVHCLSLNCSWYERSFLALKLSLSPYSSTTAQSPAIRSLAKGIPHHTSSHGRARQVPKFGR